MGKLASAKGDRAAAKKTAAIATLLGGIVVIVDQGIKFWVRAHFPLGFMARFGPLILFHSVNRGAVHGLLSSHSLLLKWTFPAISIAFVAATPFLSRKCGIPALYCVGIILGGGFSNWMDRMLHNQVTDYLRLPLSINANIADVAMSTAWAVVLLACVRKKLGNLRAKQKPSIPEL